ncbi:MAG TPA: gamma-glutamyl-gamma-aminobutyrate hydrolase family protein [Acidimicrobiales bacterium]|jgi:GMP synthase-like glutamine amidotransferase|nr:gamma-glutamyl-gamma-aminobutyrate hydrolase family protein [Acidimicrobiales bacterium]
MTNCLVVQHAAVESAYAIGDALERAGVGIDVRRMDAGDPVPADPTSYDGVVVMGGPMSASSDAHFPSRRAELSLLAGALRAGVPTLGVCLGAQLLALAAGSTVRSGEYGPEIGWATIGLSSDATEDSILAGLPRHIAVLHWHGATYSCLPGRRTWLGARGIGTRPSGRAGRPGASSSIWRSQPKRSTR